MNQSIDFIHFNNTLNTPLISLLRTSINIIINSLNLSQTIFTFPQYKSLISRITESAAAQLSITQDSTRIAFYNFLINLTTRQSFPLTIKDLLLETIKILERCIYIHSLHTFHKQ